MDDLLDALARLNARVEILERRLSALELASQSQNAIPAQSLHLPPAKHADDSDLSQAGGVFPVLGKAMLGIAGAYLLRAVAESGSFPKLAVVGLALAYAGMWLVWAARVPIEARFARTAYAATSALILTPMLWELTLRFQVLTTAVTSSVLSVFVITSLALSWKRDLAGILWVSAISATLTALGLLFASYDPVPFATAILVTACAIEVAAYYGLAPTLKGAVAVAADIATCATLYIYASPETARAAYSGANGRVVTILAVGLFVIYGASTTLRTTVLRRRLSIFEIAQAVLAFMAAALWVLHFSPARGALIVGCGCVFLSVATYAAAFIFCSHTMETRNYHVYATWSLMLLLAGAFLTLPATYLSLCLSAVAILGTIAGCRTGRLTLEFHGLIYLVAAAYTSGLLSYGGLALAGTFPNAPGWLVWSVAVAAVICYAIGGSYRGEQWPYRVLELLSAMLAASAVLIFLVSLLVWIAAIGMVLAPSHVAVIRTLITCAVALALSFSGSRWKRVELIWLAYGMLALVTAKLLFEDIRRSHPASIAVSIFLYAVALIMISRVAQWGEKIQESAICEAPHSLSTAAK